MDAEKTTWKPVPLAMDDELKRDVEAVAKSLNQKQAQIMREAIRKGLPLVKSGATADVLTLDGELSQFLNELAKVYHRSRNSILLESIRRGIRAVEAHLLHSSPGDVPPEVSKIMLDTNPDAEPLLREVRNAKIAKGALQIQLDDLLEHCPEARARKEVVEKAMELHRKRHGSWPSLWGHGVNTAELKRQVAALTAELEKGAGTSPETVSTVQGLKAQAGPRYAVKSVAKLPFTTEQAKLSPETVESRRRKLAVKRLAAFLKIPKDVGAITTEEIEWQVAMHEKHGADAAKWPKVEVERHYKSPKFRKSLKNRNTAN